MFNTYVTVFEKNKDKEGWSDRRVDVQSGDMIKDIFAPHREGLDLARVGDAYIYYQMAYLDTVSGPMARVVDNSGEIVYMCSPVVVLFCDGDTPRDPHEGEMDELLKKLELFRG